MVLLAFMATQMRDTLAQVTALFVEKINALIKNLKTPKNGKSIANSTTKTIVPDK